MTLHQRFIDQLERDGVFSFAEYVPSCGGCGDSGGSCGVCGFGGGFGDEDGE